MTGDLALCSCRAPVGSPQCQECGGAVALPPVRISRLKLMARSPAHYLAAAQKPAPWRERGSALHALVLGGPRAVAYPGKARRGKEWEAFKAEHADDVILTGAEYAKTLAMAEAVQANKTAMQLLEGSHELEVNWTKMGRACQSHIDNLCSLGSFVTELKSCENGQPDRFAWAALRYGYHAQLAWYQEAVRAAGLGDPQQAYIVAVESSAPYVVTVLRLTDRALEHGQKMCRVWFERLLACEAAGAWPGYAESIVSLDAPEDDPELIFGTSGEVATESEEVPF